MKDDHSPRPPSGTDSAARRPRRSAFATTRWSLVAAAGGPAGPHEQKALSELCHIYWYPIYCYTRRRGLAHAEAEDAVQSLFLKILEGRFFARSDPAKGRLRTFLIHSLECHLRDQWRKSRASARGSGLASVPLDAADAERRFALEDPTTPTPGQALDRAWAAELLRRAEAAVREQVREQRQTHFFDLLQPHLFLQPLDHASAERIALALQASVTHVKVSLHRFRRQLLAALRSQIAETVATEAEIEEEIAALREILEQLGASVLLEERRGSRQSGPKSTPGRSQA